MKKKEKTMKNVEKERTKKTMNNDEKQRKNKDT